jgi:hypothetical protein
VIEAEPAVVDALQTGLGAAVADGHAWAGRAGIVPYRHQERVHAFAYAGGDQLGEDHRHPTVHGGVADVVLAGSLERRVDDEVGAVHVVRGSGTDRGHVRSVAGLSHGEAARQLQAEDVLEVSIVVVLGAEVQHRAAEQAPLHARFDQQREVAVREHLEGGDRGSDVVLSTEALRIAEPGISLPRKVPGLRHDQLTVVVAGQVMDGREHVEVGQSSGLFADGAPAAVEQLPQRLEIGRRGERWSGHRNRR